MEKKSKLISFRVSKEEYEELSSRIPLKMKQDKMGEFVKDDEGNVKQIPLMSISTFIRGAVLGKRLFAVDRVVEEEKVIAAAKIGNNINYIARRLNSDHKKGIVDQITYEEMLALLRETRDEMYDILAPIR
jgi:hypothetical protein